MTASLRVLTAALGAAGLAAAVGCARPDTATALATASVSFPNALTTPRTYLTLTALDGVVIAAGGQLPQSGSSMGEPTAAADAWVPAYAGTVVFQPIAPLSVPRLGAVAVPVASGTVHHVLVAGGWTGQPNPGFTPTAAADLYTPAGLGTIAHTALPAMISPRADHAGATLADGRALVCGGVDAAKASLASCEVFAPSVGAWIPVAPMAHPRNNFTLTLLADGRVLAAGGVMDSYVMAPDVELYDPSANVWSRIPAPSISRRNHGAFRLQDGRVVIAGGTAGTDQNISTDAVVFDPLLGTFSPIPGLSQPRYAFEGTVLADGRVLIAGGRGKPAGSAYADTLSSVEVLDPASMTWTVQPPMTVPRLGFGLALLADGRVLVAGGDVSASAELISVPPVCVPTTCGSAVCGTLPDGCGGTLTCGTCGSGQVCSANQCVDPTAAAWDAGLGVPRCSTAGPACDSGTLLVGRGRVGPELHEPNTLTSVACADGTGGAFHSDESLDRLRIVSVDGGPLTAGRPARIEATVWAYSGAYGSDRLDLYLASDPDLAWTLVATLTPTGPGAQTLSTVVTLPWSQRQVLRGNFRYGGNAGPCTPGAYDDRDDLVFAVLTPQDLRAPVARIVAPAANAVVKGVVPVTVEAWDDVGVSRVELWDASGAASGLHALTWDAGDAASTVHTFQWDASSLPTSSHTLYARAFDRAGNVGTSAWVTVRVTPPDPEGVGTIILASYDATRKAPACAVRATGCDTGTLVNGRAAVGPEANAPNTIGGTCADGGGGTYHSDESLDRLRVFTLRNAPLAPGQTVRVEATVWAYGAGDVLDVWYAADASSPAWTLAGSVPVNTKGAQTVSVDYVLPAGTVQAVRGSFRYGGAATACTTGGYDDHDDLVFVTR